MLQLRWSSRKEEEKSSTTRYDILARASQFYCRAFAVAVSFFATCAISAHLCCPGKTLSIEAQSAIIHRIKLMFGTARRVYEQFFFSFVLN